MVLAAETGFAGADDGLRAVGDLELGEDIGDIVAYRLRAERQFPCDGGIRMSARDQVEDLTLSVREGRENPGRRKRRPREVREHTLGDRRAEDRPTPPDGPDRTHQLVGVLENVAAPPP
jgi:hypothetical protein